MNPVTFVAKKREYRIIVKPADRQFDEARRPITIRGERVEFTNHRFTTSDPGLIAWLKAHPLFGVTFTSADGTPSPSIAESKARLEGIVSPSGQRLIEPGDMPPTTVPQSYETPVTRDEIEIMIDQKLDGFLSKVAGLMQSQAVAREQVPAPKRTFTCPVEGCGEVFKSGVEVGKHKKLAHPELGIA